MQRLIANTGPIAHMRGDGPITGHVEKVEDLVSGSGMAILIEDHVIKKIGENDVMVSEFSNVDVVDIAGRAVIPGLVDSHTHLIWAGDRSREISWKQQGMTYKKISEMGGGIAATVLPTRESTDKDLAELGIKRMKEALRNGTTHLEAKSGYGLNLETELRLLKIAESISALDNLPSLDLTWLGAHSAPPGGNIDKYFEDVLSNQLPEIIDQGIARSADVFCEPGWFSVEQTEEILKESRSGGLDLRLHIDEFEDGGGGQLAADYSVDTADHAHHTNDEAREAMSDAGVNCGFLPGTPYSMGEDYPPFKKCLDNNWVWSIATDFNPNCRTLSLPFIGSILVQRNEISPITSLAACTRNSAETTPHPSGLKHGQIVEGGIANLNILDSPYWESWCLQPGHSPFFGTVLDGQMIYH